MADSERLSARAQEAVARMKAAAGLDEERERRIAERAAALPENWLEIENRKALEETRAERSRIMLSRLEPRYRDAVPRHQESLDWLADYRADRKRNLVIVGTTGVGKTWELNALARILLGEFVPVTVISAADMVDSLKPNQDGVSDEGQFKVSPVLMLDDLGAERLTEFAATRLLSVLDYRNRKMLPTVFTTNLTPRELSRAYDPRTFRRIFDGSRMLLIEHGPTPSYPFDQGTLL
jgi:DNA replication protein DnaC